MTVSVWKWEGGRLTVEAKRPAFGIMPNETVNVPEFTYVEIDWGVDTFPEGASYEQGIRNEAIMVMFFLGDERQPSGAFFIPDSPYFIALFLCNGDDRVDHPYVGPTSRRAAAMFARRSPAGRSGDHPIQSVGGLSVLFRQGRRRRPGRLRDRPGAGHQEGGWRGQGVRLYSGNPVFRLKNFNRGRGTSLDVDKEELI